MGNNYSDISGDYGAESFEGTGMLAFRDIPEFIPEHNRENIKAIDFGCGAGRSSKLLKSLNIDTVGVDVSHEMLNQAINDNEAGGKFLRINPISLPFKNESFDLMALLARFIWGYQNRAGN